MDNKVEKIDLDHVDWKSSREFFESLGEALDKIDDKDESYDFTWVGKRRCVIEAGAPITKILRPNYEASKNFDTTNNSLIVGDNLDALKILQESYLGKISLIYIDPPYNRGKDLLYPDNYHETKDDYSDSSTNEDGEVQISEDGLIENSKLNGRYHSRWLSMMYPRLRLAKNLLSEDGVIFISIDDNEQANLKKICDEIFGEENCVAQIVNKTPNQTADTNKKQVHEYILVYCKDIFYGKLLAGEKIIQSARCTTGKEEQTMPIIEFAAGLPVENIPDGRYDGPKQLGGNEDIELIDGELVVENGKLKYPVKLKARWSNPNDLKAYMAKINSGSSEKIYNKFGKELTNLYLKGLRFQPIMEKVGYNDIESIIEITSKGSGDLKKLNLEKYFPYPKSVALIKYLLSLGKDDSIVLDFFAGSGTTGQAVMELNSEGGSRKYILIQYPEKCKEGEPAKKDGYDSIDMVTAERLRRAGDRIKNSDHKNAFDDGFRLFYVDGKNENDGVRRSLSEIQQNSIFDMVDNIKKDRSPLDLLFGVVYASALPFDLKLETRKIGDNTVYLYGYLDEGTGLAACFDDKVPEETVKEIAKLKTLTAAFKDTSFEDSAEKINLSEHFRIISPDTKVKVI